MKIPHLIVSDIEGNFIEVPELQMAGMNLMKPTSPSEEALIPLPEGFQLITLPERVAIGYDISTEKFAQLREYNGKRVYPVASIMSSNYLRLLGSVFTAVLDAPRLLPLGYTATGAINGQYYISAKKLDPDWPPELNSTDIQNMDQRLLQLLKDFPKNRLSEYFINQYQRFHEFLEALNAYNFIFQEGELTFSLYLLNPRTPTNSVKLPHKQRASILLQNSQKAIPFIPSIKEVIEIGTSHLQNSSQGTVVLQITNEDIPVLSVEQIITELRKQTNDGSIQVSIIWNKTRQKSPSQKLDYIREVQKFCKAGMDHLSIQINSAQNIYYKKFEPFKLNKLEDIIESFQIASDHNCSCVLDYLTFPGLTDHPSEIEALEKFIKETNIDMLKLHNLEIDPEQYIDELSLFTLTREQIGMQNWLKRIQSAFPDLKMGYFTTDTSIEKAQCSDV